MRAKILTRIKKNKKQEKVFLFHAKMKSEKQVASLRKLSWNAADRQNFNMKKGMDKIFGK